MFNFPQGKEFDISKVKLYSSSNIMIESKQRIIKLIFFPHSIKTII